MRVKLARTLGRSLVFIAVVERQGNGTPHLHLMVGSFLPKQWISAAWQSLGGGWATRIEYADLHRVSAYLAKYVTEESACELPWGTRRFSTSRGLALFPRSKTGAAWVLIAASIELIRQSASGISSETIETEPDGARSLRAFVAEAIMPTLAVRLIDGGPRLATEVLPRCKR